MKRYDDSIIQELRESVDAEDNRFDEEFQNKWSPNEVFDSVYNNHIKVSPDIIKQWIKAIYKIDLDEVSDKIMKEKS